MTKEKDFKRKKGLPLTRKEYNLYSKLWKRFISEKLTLNKFICRVLFMCPGKDLHIREQITKWSKTYSF